MTSDEIRSVLDPQDSSAQPYRIGEDPLDSGAWDWDAQTNIWNAVVQFEGENDASDPVVLQLEIQLVGFDVPGVVPYAVVCWVAVPPDQLRDDAAAHPPLLDLLNMLNREPGVKFRLDGDGGETALVIESDLPAPLATRENVQIAIDRSVQALTTYFDDIEADAL